MTIISVASGPRRSCRARAKGAQVLSPDTVTLDHAADPVSKAERCIVLGTESRDLMTCQQKIKSTLFEVLKIDREEKKSDIVTFHSLRGRKNVALNILRQCPFVLPVKVYMGQRTR